MKQILQSTYNIFTYAAMYLCVATGYGQIAEDSALRFVKPAMASRIPNSPKPIPSGDKGQIATVQLSANGVRDYHLEFLGELRGVQRLSLANTGVRGDFLENIRDPDSVVELDLSYTPVSDDAIPHIANLRNLRVLHLRGAPISNKEIKRLRALSSLTALSLPGAVTDDALHVVKDLSNLQWLDCRGSGVEGKGLGELANTKLRVLILGPHTRTFESLGDLLTLRQLYVPSNGYVDESALREIGKLHNLRRLNLSYCTQVNDAWLGHLNALSALRSLDISATLVHDGAGFPFESLRSLYVAGCPVTPKGIADICRLKGLRRVDITGIPPWCESAVERLRNELPNCQVKTTLQKPPSGN